MIQDAELREMFRVESEEHLQKIDACLFSLEKEPDGRKVMEELYREAHSLKGSARMLGVRAVEELAHKMESLIGTPLKTGVVFTADLDNVLSATAAALGKLVLEAVTGEKAGVDIPALTKKLEAAQKALGEPPAGVASRGESEQRNAQPPVAPEGETEAVHESEPASPLKLNTVRVDIKKLDELMTHASELSVLKIRIQRRLAESEEAEDMLEKLIAGGAANGGKGRMEELLEQVSTLKAELREDASRMEYIAAGLDGGIRNIRMVPFSTLFAPFPRMVREMAHEKGKQARLETGGGDVAADKKIIEDLKDPLMHIVRNFIEHGLDEPEARVKKGKPPEGVLRVSVQRTDNGILMEAIDDGNGPELEKIRDRAVRNNLHTQEEVEKLSPAELLGLVFRPGFSTSRFITNVAGRGIGLNVVQAAVERLKGSAIAEMPAGGGFSVTMRLPASIYSMRALIAGAGRRKYAIPLDYVHKTAYVQKAEIFMMEGKEAVFLDGRAVHVGRLGAILEMPEEAQREQASAADEPLSCVFLSVNNEAAGLIADEILDEQEIILKHHCGMLKRVRNVAGATILEDGSVCMILSPPDLVRSVRRAASAVPKTATPQKAERKAVLLVEDSLTTRTQEKRILERAGYEVVSAVNGVEALEKLAARKFDAVVTDILMPEMDGLELTGRIKKDARYKDIPVVLVTSLASGEDKKRGMEAGASAYIPKSEFDQLFLIETLRRLV